VTKKINLLSMFILAVAIASALFLSPATGGQESQRGACEQACNETFKACNTAPNANRALCSTQYKECRDKCKEVDPHPSPTPTVSPTPTPDVSPTPTPDVSPTPTPDVSPTPTPDVSPTPTPEGPASARGQCEQDCNAAYKECNKAPGANRAACSSQYKDCRDKCKEVDPHPSPTPSPTPTPTP
jgi:type II secretory pathway pseudopilin PulG